MPRSHSFIHYITSMQSGHMACGEPHPYYASRQKADVTCPDCRRLLGKPLEMPESALLRAVREAAAAHSWLCYHPWRSDNSEAGWPDVALAKPGHPLLLAELKTATGKLTVAQARWQTTLAQCTGIQCGVWRPGDLPALLTVLKERPMRNTSQTILVPLAARAGLDGPAHAPTTLGTRATPAGGLTMPPDDEEPLSPEGYAATGGSVCPACGGTDLERRHYDQSAPGSVTRTWRCEHCGATWSAVYELTGYEGLCQPRTPH